MPRGWSSSTTAAITAAEPDGTAGPTAVFGRVTSSPPHRNEEYPNHATVPNPIRPTAPQVPDRTIARCLRCPMCLTAPTS